MSTRAKAPTVPAPPHDAPPPSPGGRTPELIDLLLTVGYIDGQFHQREHVFIERYLDSVLLVLEASAPPDERANVRAAWQAHFADVYAQVHAVIARLSVEVMTSGDASYVPTRLKVRAVTIFRGLPSAEQKTALELVRSLMHADGLVSQPEQLLYDELLEFFTAPVRAKPRDATALAPTLLGAPAITVPPAAPLVISAPQLRDLHSLAHPLLDPLEQTYSPHPQELQAQVALDYQLVSQAMTAWHRLRQLGE